MRRIAIGIAVLLAVSSCSTSDSSESTTSAPSPTTTAAAQPAPSADLSVAASSLGDIVVDADGMTLYLFMPDAQGDSTCYDQCEATWPPLVDEVGAGSGIDAALLGTTTRTDGSTQVTYDGWPLYHFGGDATSGDINGQGLNGVWYVVDPTGTAVGQAASQDDAGASYNY